MELEIERLAFDSLRNLREVAEPVTQKGSCDYAEQKGNNKYEAEAASRGQVVKGPGGQGEEFSLDSKSNGKPLTCRGENGLETGKSSLRHERRLLWLSGSM